MKKMYRRMLLFSSTVVFLAVAPLIILYALGYRFGSYIVDPLPVGVVIVESQPRGATVTINNQTVGSTPRAITNLTPGKTSIQLSSQGFTTWQKEIEVLPASVIELRDVWLFPEKPATHSLISSVVSFSLSPNRRYLAVVDHKNFIHLIDEEGKNLRPPFSLSHSPKTLLWAPDSTALLFHYSTRSPQIYSLTTDNLAPLTLANISPQSQVVWDQRIPARLLIHTAQNVLQTYTLTNQATGVIASDVIDFAPSTRYIYTIEQDNLISIRNLQGEEIEQLPLLSDHHPRQLAVTPADKLAFLTTEQELYAQDADNNFVMAATGVDDFGWSPDGQLLYIQSEPNALHVYNPGYTYFSWFPAKELRLIIRLSRPITHPQWFAASRHLIYQVDDQIFITEIDTRDRPTSYQLDTTNTGDAKVAVGRDGDVVYYTKLTQNQAELVSAKLTLP